MAFAIGQRVKKMTRLIDADELLDWSEIIPLTDDGGIDINDFEEKLKTMPTIDAVPVIRCKDCKYSSPNQVYGCRIHSFADDLDKRMYSDDFCSMAERKE